MSWKKQLREAYKKELPEHGPQRLLEKAGLEPSKKAKTYHDFRRPLKVGIAVAATVLLVAPIAVFLASGFTTKNSFSAKNIRFDAATRVSLQKQQAVALNQIEYTDHDYEEVPISTEFSASVNAFASSFHQSFATQDSFLYSPLGLYLNLDLLSLGASGPVEADFQAYLGTKSLRDQNVVKAIEGNFFTGNSGAAHIYQGAFLEKNQPLQAGYVDALTSRRCEAFSLDLAKGDSTIGDWSEQHIGMRLSAEDLGYQDLTIAYWFTLLDFKGRWDVAYDSAKTSKRPFYGSETKQLDFMTHAVWIGTYGKQTKINPYRGIYDYGDYVSAYDSYRYGYSIQYLVPKKVEDDIFVLTKGKNIFEEDQTKALPTKEGEEGAITNLVYYLPKFEESTKLDLTDSVKKMGLSSPYSNFQHSLDRAFVLDDDGGVVKYTKQVNHIRFDEDGTTAKSITWSMGMAGAAAPIGASATYVVDLNQPFLYVIRDPHGLPLFCGAYRG